MSKYLSNLIYCCEDDDESTDINCPECGSPATYDDDGINYSNDNCPNSK